MTGSATPRRATAARKAAAAGNRRRRQGLSPEAYRSLFETIDDAYCVIEMIFDEDDRPVDFVYLETNPAFVVQAGQEMRGRRIREIVPDFEQAWIDHYGRVAKTGKPVRLEGVVAGLGDQWFQTAATRVGGEDSRQVVVRFTNITPRKRGEAALRASGTRKELLLGLADSVRPMSSVEEIVAVTCRVVGEHLQADRVLYADVDTPSGRVLIDRNWTSEACSPLLGVFALAEFSAIVPSFQRGETAVVPDTRLHPLTRAHRENYAGWDFRSFVAVPLVKRDAWVNSFVVHSVAPRTWTGEEVALIEEVAERTWEAVERARAEREVRESERRYRSVFTAIDEGFALCEMICDEHGRARDYRILAANPATEQMIGIPAEKAIGRTVREVVPDVDDDWIATCARAGLGGESVRLEQYMAWFDRWIEIYLTPSGEPGDGRFAAVYNDRTARKRAEAALRESEERQAFLLTLGDAMRRLSDPVAIQKLAARLLGERLGVDRCGYAEIDGSGEFIAIRDEYFAPGVPPLVGRYRLQDFGEGSLDVLRCGETVVLNDAPADPTPNDAASSAVLAGLHARAAVNTPLIKGGRLRAVLFAHQKQPRAWAGTEIGLVKDVAERTWAAVEQARAEAALRESEARHAFLLRLSDALRTVADPLEVQAVALRVLGDHLGVGRVFFAEVDQERDEYVIARSYANGVPPLHGRLRLSEIPATAQLAGTGETVVVHDASRDARLSDAERAAYAAMDMTAAVVVPLIREGCWVVGLGVQQATPRHWSPHEISLIHEAAERAWPAVERARAERALRGSEERLQRALAIDTVGVSFFNLDGAITDANEAFLRMGGHTRAELEQGRLYWGMLTPQDWVAVSQAAIQELTETGRSTPYEKEYFRKDGSRWAGLFAATMLTEREGVEFVVDLTQLKAAEAATRAERERRDRSEREFVANAAHELRTPLAAIIASVEALDAGAKEQAGQRDRFFGHIKREAARLSRLSESLLMLAQVETMNEVPRSEVAIRPVLEHVAEVLHPRPGVIVAVRASPTLTVLTNAGLLERVVENLAVNAAKHSDRGTIELRAHETASAVIVEVSDSGPGISSTTATLAFDRFYRGGARDADGFGLGLAIAQQAAHALAGRLTLEPSDGGGTVARLSIPTADA